MSFLTARPVEVPVAGGTLHCGQWGDSGPVVVAAHGITGNHVSFELLGRRLGGELRLVAPDLRGRGASAGLPGPFGLPRHAEDLVAVLDHFGVGSGIVLGHSMGAYVATVVAAEFPERLSAMVLADGGLPLPLPAGITVEQALELVVGPAVARLSMTFPTRAAYHDFWKAHPAVGASWGPMAEAYVDYDLVGEEGDLHSRVSSQAVHDDSADTLVNEVVHTALSKVRCPTLLVRAEGGMLGMGTPPLLADETVAPWVEQVASLDDLGIVRGVDHYTLLLSETGVDGVADAVRRAVSVAASAAGRTGTTPS